MNRLKNHFDNYNGRYFGNLLVILLTRQRIIKTLVMVLTYLVIFNIVNKLSKNNNYYISILLLLCVPIPILAQAIVWTSGFANYVFSTGLFFVLAYLLFRKEKTSKILILILAFSSSLFLENMTIMLFVVSVIMLIYSIIKYTKIKKSNINKEKIKENKITNKLNEENKVVEEISLNKEKLKKSISLFTGSILGFITMFTNSVYFNIVDEKDSYRTMSFGIKETIKKFFNNFNYIFSEQMFSGAIILMTVLFGFITFLYIKQKDKNKKISCFFSLFLISYIYFLFKTVSPNSLPALKYMRVLDFFVSITYLLSIIGTIFVLDFNEEIKKRILIYISVIGLYTLPIMIVSPIGPRNIFFIYIMFILILQDLSKIIILDSNYIKIKPFLKIGILVTCAIYFLIYGHIYRIDQKRIEYLKKYPSEEVIELPEMPYKDYVHVINPVNPFFTHAFLSYHNRSDIKKIKLIKYEEWNKKYKELIYNEK